MKLAYVTARYEPEIGGIETHVRALAQRAVRAGHDVEVLTGCHRSGLPTWELDGGVVVRRFRVVPPSRRYPVLPALWSELRGRDDLDLLHVHGYHDSTSLFAAAAVAGPIPLVFTPHYHGTGHSPLGLLLHRPYRVAGRRVIEGSDLLICVTEAEADLVRAHFPGARPKVVVISNGVDRDGLASAAPFADSAWSGGALVLVAGRLEPYKQVDRVVAAVGMLRGRVALRVIGGGPSEALISEEISDRIPVGRAGMLGWVSRTDLARWYRSASVVVSLSRHEAQGIVPLEALAAGARVVASDIPAHRDVARLAPSFVTLVPATAEPASIATAIATALTGARPRPGAIAVPTWDETAAATFDRYRILTRAAIPRVLR